MAAWVAYPNRINEKKRYERLKRIPQHRHRPCCGRRRRPSRPLLMAETAVWVPYESPAHVRATASSTVDVDLMVSVDGTGFASANLQDHASCWNVPSTRPADARFLTGALTRWHGVRRPRNGRQQAALKVHSSMVQLASCTPSVMPAARAVVAEPWELATARALHGRGLDHRV